MPPALALPADCHATFCLCPESILGGTISGYFCAISHHFTVSFGQCTDARIDLVFYGEAELRANRNEGRPGTPSLLIGEWRWSLPLCRQRWAHPNGRRLPICRSYFGDVAVDHSVIANLKSKGPPLAPPFSHYHIVCFRLHQFLPIVIYHTSTEPIP